MATVRRIRPGEAGYGRKKFVARGTYKGELYTVRFGDSDMEIRRDDPKRRRAFRARMGCDDPGPPNRARYWSCKFWSDTPVSELLKR